jgi:hypothetical protein
LEAADSYSFGLLSTMRFALPADRSMDLRDSGQARALRHVFFAERSAHKSAEYGDAAPQEIETSAVIGGGTMGTGIAAVMPVCLSSWWNGTRRLWNAVWPMSAPSSRQRRSVAA